MFLAPIYRFVVRLIHLYKWTELQVIKAIYPLLEKKAVEMIARIGLVLHFVEDGDIYSPSTWTKEQEVEARAKCYKEYDRLVHLKIFRKKEYLCRLCSEGTLGTGLMYMEKNVEACESEDDLTEACRRFLEAGYFSLYLHPVNRFLNYLELCVFNLQTKDRSTKVADLHYDLGNDLYESFLDPYMQYSCGYWARSSNLFDAQIDKMELIAKKLNLNKPGLRVLDIGCGWGGLCKYLSENYKVECVGVTISVEQAKHARQICDGLPVEIRVQDYRDVTEKFDRMVSVGMLEHVGFRNYNEYFKVAHRNLKDEGIFVLHTIGLNHGDMPRSEAWLTTFIFPNSNLPFPNDITKETEGKFIIEDWHNFGLDYAKTLEAWGERFKKNWPKIQNKYGEKFYRMWIYYIYMCAGFFKSRRGQLWQIVLSKDGIKQDYRAAR